MTQISISDLKKSQSIVQDIRWDVTPKIFLDPSSALEDESGQEVDITRGYMLYVDIINDKPVLVIMQMRRIMSKTVGYVIDIPEDLLREAMHCTDKECVAGMYPLGEKLEDWLKKELSLS
jgi:hypothetical protein